MDATCWVSRGVSIENQYSTGSPLKTLLLTCHVLPFIVMIFFSVPDFFQFIHWFCFECSGLVHERYSRRGPSLYVYCVVYFCINAIPCRRSLNFLLALLHFWRRTGMNLDNENVYTSIVIYTCMINLWYVMTSLPNFAGMVLSVNMFVHWFACFSHSIKSYVDDYLFDIIMIKHVTVSRSFPSK